MSAPRRRVALGPITPLQVASKGNIQGSSTGSLSLVKLQLSPSENNDKVETPRTYDRKALSELLRSSASTLVHTDNQLKEAREQIEGLKLSLAAKDKELTISNRSLATLTTAETQTEEESGTSSSASAQQASAEVESILTHTVETQTHTDEESRAQDCKEVIISESNFASVDEFEAIVCELVAARLQVLTLSSALEAAQSELKYHSKVASSDARPR